MGKIGVAEDEARKYYETHLDEFTSAPTVTLREILVAVKSDPKGVNVAVDEAAKAKAEEIRRRVTTGGENYEKVAADVSESPSKANGGLIGPISVNELSPELRAAVQTMKVGDVTQVLAARGGYQLFRLESITPTQTMPFDQAREQISERVFTDKRKIEYSKYLEKLRAQAIIEWKNPDVKRAFDEGLKRQTTAP
jgi:parvulin-like peptidyl-prolyl isomerase